MMTPDQFAARAVGMPWVRWRSDWIGADCFGLVVLYYREVLGIELGTVPHTDVAAGFDQSSGWVECEPVAGATAWMSWRDGRPQHVGILLDDTRAIHSEGSHEAGGSVRVTRLDVLRRAYGLIRFYRHTSC
jgi:cell wall-associated NlpC family hydrolase